MSDITKNNKLKKISKMIKKGSKVRVHYTGKLENEKVFDTSVEKDPLEVVVGQSGLIKGFENGLMGMKEGDKKTIEIDPKNGYGDYIDGRIQEIEKSKLPNDIEVGLVLQATTEDGDIVLMVKEIKEDVVTLDANHPLAGRRLIFDLEIIEVINE
ncbi:peptidylprolyl isomerase [bacterium]|nr:peptidylprolyl isomerase [bacterium]